MKANHRLSVILAGVLVSLTGCEKASSPVASNAGAPVVSVDGTVLTRGQLDARVEFMLKLARRADPQMKSSNYQSLSNRLATTYPQVFVSRTLVRHYADKEKIAIPDETMKRFRKLALRHVRHLRAKDYDALLSKLGADAEIFDGQVRDEALTDAVKAHVIAANPTNLPADYAARRLEEIKAYNKRMDATNAVIHARANEVWRKLKAGEPFKEVAKAYTEIEEERAEGGDWGLLDDKILEDFPALLRAVKNLKVGEFSAPVEGDNGLMIVRLDEKGEDKDEYSLSRIYFCLPMFAREAPPAELIAEAKKKHGEQVWADFQKRLEQEAKIDYFGNDKKPGANKKKEAVK